VTGQPHMFAVRRLSPFQGTTQVVELGEARALSLDGIRWEIQVRCAQPEHTWRSSNKGEPVLRYFRFGVWSKETGLRWVPVTPLFDLDLLLSGSSALTEILPASIDALPFALADRYELWLLDPDELPFALLASSMSAPSGTGTRSEPWSANGRSDQSFQSPRLLKRGIPARQGMDHRHHVGLLERLVRDTAGHPVRVVWLTRDESGSGSPVELDRVEQASPSKPFTAKDLPPLLLREEWLEPTDRDLVQDYLDWCAPYLLTLPDIDDEHRERLEHAARTRPLELDMLCRLYPKILNPELVKSIRVEAQIRRSRVA
jgi:hypothetical protein